MKSLSRLMLWMAALGLLFPRLSPVMADDARPAAGNQQAVRVAAVDVKLAENGTLHGQLLNREGAAKANRTVTVAASGQVVAQAMTDAKGNFAIPLAKGGVYTITDGETGAVVRVWTNAAAPPSAQTGILLVSDTALARANLGERPLVPILGLAAIAGVVAAVIIATTDDDAS